MSALCEKAQLLGRAYELERETKRQKVQEEKEESGVGFGVEQLEFNRGMPENAAKLEKLHGDYYHGPYCSNETNPEAIEHHAGEIAYTWYKWENNELKCPVEACLPPVMALVPSNGLVSFHWISSFLCLLARSLLRPRTSAACAIACQGR